jgi:sulfatase modifying factor 1
MENQKSCCALPDLPKAPQARKSAFPPQGNHSAGQSAVVIPGGIGLRGAAKAEIPFDGESPMQRVKLAPFRIAAITVTNAEFAEFVRATGYITEAEEIGWSFVFWLQVPDSVGPTQGVAAVQWWRRVDGANWQDVNGPGTAAQACLPDHPVVQVSWRDATAEWEHAARGGLGDVRFPWGDAEPDDKSVFPCNIWQGNFPHENLMLDGYETTAPAKSYSPNGYGLYNMAGNVWEWTSEPFKVKSLKKAAAARLETMKGYKLLKGGSYLCHRSYCYRYRIAARSGNSPDSATTHQGFRVAWDAT